MGIICFPAWHFNYFCVLLWPMKSELSILIPVYNTVCTGLVASLCRQADAVDGLCYEVIVVDDDSPDRSLTESNRQGLDSFPHCRYIVREKNVGSAATRNYLGSLARYQWLLFIDCDVSVPSCLISRYLECSDSDVVNGGIAVGDDDKCLWRGNLRYLYEKSSESGHVASLRQQRRYHEFRSTNFVISRDAFSVCQFDERFKHSGYEDVMFGKSMKEHGLSVTHIDNPVVMTDFEPNSSYVAKIERSLRTLHEFRSDLSGYSRILTFSACIHLKPVLWSIRVWHWLFGRLERSNLCGSRPSLRVFDLYRIGYYLSL